MSSIRDIIARRRPAQTPQAPERLAEEAINPEETPIEGLPPEIKALYRSEPEGVDKVAERLDDVPRWQPKPPRRTMGSEQSAQDTANGESRRPRPPSPMMESPKAESPKAESPVTESASPRLNIWDLDEADTGTEEAEPLILRAQQAVAQAETAQTEKPAAPVPVPEPAAPTPRAQAGGRPKTRLLGFHANDDVANVFAAERAPTSTQSIKCPIGWVVIVDGPGYGTSFALAPGLSTVGRGADQTIPLDFGDDSVSRDNHASIAFDEEENKVLIGHGGKSNIVRVNGKPLVSSQEMNNGDEIRIGKTTLRFVALCGPDFRWTANDQEAAADE